MRALREKMKEAAKQDNRGLSLVEVLCAIAIFSLVAAAIGTVIVLSARTFNRGVTETSLQQEAQLVANRIGTIVQDACEASFDEGARTLTLKTNENKTYTISLSGQELVYSDDTMSGAKLAEKIQSFSVKTDDFEKSNTVYLDMRVADGNKVYNVQYAIAARNQMTTDIPNTPLAEHASIFTDSEVVMVPGETYKIPYSVAGKVTIGMDAAITSGTATIGAVGLDGVEVTIPTGTTDTVVQLQVFTKDTIDGTTTPKATANINIRIRRVNSISVSHNSDRSAVDPSKSGNSYEAQGCVYTFYARVSADNPEKQAGTTYDSGWKNPNFVYWSDKATLNGTPVNVTDYFDVVYSTDLNIPTAKYTIKEDLPSGLELTVRATSKHAKGENKASSDYYVDTKGVHWNEDSIKARETKVESKLEITIEPNHSGEVALGMKGGKTSDISFVYNNRSDSTTKAEYNASMDKVKITLGNDEKGVGKNPAEGEKYTFTIDVLVKGTKKSTITVHVRRIENISLEVIDNAHDASGNLMDNPTYDFRTRINVDNNKNDDNMQNAVKYLILDKSGEPDKLSPTVAKTLSSRISWELKNTKTGNVLQKDSVICMAGTSASDNGQVIGEYTKEYKVNSTLYYKIVNVKPARVEQDASGNWYLKQVPEVDIKLGNGDDLPANTELTVKVEMLHPLGGEYNETGIAYGIAEAEISRQGKQSVIIPELIVAEPGQGTSDPAQSDYELVVPIEVSGGDVYQMTATISGNSSKDTKLSAYETADKNGNKNPYKATNAGSGSNSIWYLGLLIGTDEKGKDNSGLMDLTVTAYDQQGETVAKVESKIAIRRVTKVKIDATAKATNVSSAVITQDEKGNRYLNYEYNKKGSTITLEAYATGYGSGGTEYFGIQKDEKGNVLRWEQDGHGKYQTPYSIKWSIYDKKGKALNLSDYFESVPTLVDIPGNGVTKSTITFTLKQALPKGTTIKATSLHALGKNDGTKTNKSGKEYDDVYDILKIDIIDPDDPVDDDIQYLDGLLRGEDFIDFPDQNPSYRPNGGHWFWRKREITNVIVHEDGTQETFYGPWEEYHLMWENSQYKKINAVESRSLLCDKRYQIQMAYMVIDQGSRTVKWPHDSKLVAAGSDSGFAGYSTSWPSSESDTPESEYSVKYNIGRGTMTFAANSEYPITFAHYGDAVKNWESETWNDAPVFYKSFGTLEEPVVLTSGKSLKVNVYGYALKSRYYQQISYARVQKLENNTWVSVKGTDICENIQDRSSFVYIKNVKSDAEKGVYRISFRVTKQDTGFWTQWNGSIWNPQYPDMSNTNYLACGSNGASGYIYIEIQ